MIPEFLVQDWVALGLRWGCYIIVEACGESKPLKSWNQEAEGENRTGPPQWCKALLLGPSSQKFYTFLIVLPRDQACNALTFGRILIEIIIGIISIGKGMAYCDLSQKRSDSWALDILRSWEDQRSSQWGKRTKRNWSTRGQVASLG